MKAVVTTLNKPEIVTLENSTRVILDINRCVRSCAVYLWVRCGARNEDSVSCGASHFLEHIFFKGSNKRSALEIARQTDEVGGVLNAFTANEYTCFYIKCLSEHAEKMLDILGDMVTSPRLDEKDIKTEKGVILEEYAMSEDSPEDLCFDEFYRGIWPDDPLGQRVLGTKKSISEMSAETLLRHKTKYYTPENTVISISGNFDREAVLEKCREYFGVQPSSGEAYTASTPVYTPHFTAIKRDFEQNQLVIGFPGLSFDSASYPAVQLLSAMLAGCVSSVMFQQLREKLGLCYDIDSGNASYKNAGVFGINMGLLSTNEEKAIAKAVEILERFPSEVDSALLNAAKEQYVAGFVMGLESAASRASYFGKKLLLKGVIESEEEAEKKIRSVSEEEISSLAKQIFDFDRVSVCTVGKVHTGKWYKSRIEAARR